MRELKALVQRRRVVLAVFAAAFVLAALSGHVLHLPFMHLDEPALIAGAFPLALWIAFAWRARIARMRALDAEAARLTDAAHNFGARCEAWLVAASQSEDLEAEALRRAVVDRHSALVAGVRAHLAGLDPQEDTVVQAMTREQERKGRHGQALLLHLAALQREALAEAQRRGFLGEARLLALDQALVDLGAVAPLPKWTVSLSDQALVALNTAFAAMLVLGASHRLTAVLAATIAAKAFIAFEAFASAPIAPADDPRTKTLAAW